MTKEGQKGGVLTLGCDPHVGGPCKESLLWVGGRKEKREEGGGREEVGSQRKAEPSPRGEETHASY